MTWVLEIKLTSDDNMGTITEKKVTLSGYMSEVENTLTERVADLLP